MVKKKGSYTYTFYDKLNEVEKFCERSGEGHKPIPISKREYEEIRKGQDSRFLGL